ncbi:hypothetical protein LYNGBM3L_06660 [Moorena producens 3L]|uniref:Uncharacterized protein n=1 Tax=Moorena producens 3L TaxID=489825 RepID=F4XJJ8_9CYAN|nr:hypothetical protein LYNGBM3L_06660 [Moorena producens 3L]OLT65674.1 hypothetical protein BI334_12080 [Moorena producens 3L]
MQASYSNEDIFFSPARELFEEIVEWLGSDRVCGARAWGVREQITGERVRTIKTATAAVILIDVVMTRLKVSVWVVTKPEELIRRS